MAFFGNALGRGARSQRRIAHQSALNLSDYNTMRDFLSNGGPIPIGFGSTDPGKVKAGGAPLPRIPVKGGGIEYTLPLGSVDPNDYGVIHLLANLFGFYQIDDDGTSSPADWRDWTFSLDASETADDYLEVWDDDDRLRKRFLNNVVSGMELAIGDNGRMDVNFSVVNPQEWDFWGAVTQTAGSGSVLPTFRGPVGEVLTTESLAALLIEVQNKVGDVLTLRNKDAGGTYDNTQSYTIGDPAVRIKNETGAGNRGTRARPYMFALPDGATIVTADEFQVLRRMARWSQSLPTSYVIPAVNAIIYLDGNEIPVEGSINVSGEWEDVEARVDISKEFGGNVIRQGKLNFTVELERVYADLILQAKLHNRSTASLVIDGATDAEIDTDAPAEFRAVFPQLDFEGEMFGLDEGALGNDESVTMLAGVPDSAFTDPVKGTSWTTHAAFVLRNAITAF